MARSRLPSDPAIAQFAGAAARAAVFELKARMFADAVDIRGGVSKDLDPLVKEITSWISANAAATEKELETVRRCARLRNKLFHLELSRATGQLDVQLGREGVQMFQWDGDLTKEKLISAIGEGGRQCAGSQRPMASSLDGFTRRPPAGRSGRRRESSTRRGHPGARASRVQRNGRG